LNALFILIILYILFLGIVGDWKNKFSDAQLEEFERVMRKQKGDSKVINRYLTT